MITFNIVKERHGWAIRMGERITTPFRSRDMAVREANRLAGAIGRHGERTEVIAEDADPTQPRDQITGGRASRADVSPPVQRVGLE
jgi:hypothetical protein